MTWNKGGGIGKKFKKPTLKKCCPRSSANSAKKYYEKTSKTINFENAGDENFKLFPSNSLHYVMLYNIFLLFWGKTKYFFFQRFIKLSYFMVFDLEALTIILIRILDPLLQLFKR